MIETDRRELVQPAAFRIWDPVKTAFSLVDKLSEQSPRVDAWTGFFDRDGIPIYENDIIRAHYDWRFGWVRAVVVRDIARNQFVAEATARDGQVLRVGFYSFCDAYLVGNVRQHPTKLTTAREQFAEDSFESAWIHRATFPPLTSASVN